MTGFRRISTAVLVAGVIGAAVVAVYWARPASPESEIAARLAGQRWYAMTFRHRPIGHYRAAVGRTSDGHFEFRTVLRFKLAGSTETRMTDHLVFHRRPPHALLRAEHAAFAGDERQTQVTLAAGSASTEGSAERSAAGSAEVLAGGHRRRVDFDADLMLGEYLAIERWLAEDVPGTGETHTARAIDFDRLAVVTDRWRVLARDAEGVNVGKDGRMDDSYVRLDADLVPQRMQIGALFTLQRVADHDAARAWQKGAPLFTADSHRVPVDKAIADPAALRRLVLGVDHAAGERPSWTNLLLEDTRTPEPADVADIARASAATVRYPAADPQFRTLAERAVAGLDTPAERANALTGFVHNYLRYRDTDNAGSVFDTLRDRAGDCTEFADLYTTLGRALGLPTRTVVGLAYLDTGAFALHAWNEVAIDGTWHGVDPTWDQNPADATHLALPPDAALNAIADLPNLRLRVVEAVY